VLLTVVAKRWSSEQVARRLRRRCPHRSSSHMCVETIYDGIYGKTLVIKSRNRLIILPAVSDQVRSMPLRGSLGDGAAAALLGAGAEWRLRDGGSREQARASPRLEVPRCMHASSNGTA
jgi:hypothetical protein